MLSRYRSNSAGRGQALVEFAIILPLLALLLVMAVDAGRVFFGWVALQNASRIGANYAASHSGAWNGNPAALQWQRDEFAFLVQQDLQALGCQGSPVPPPNFDPDGDGTTDFRDGALVRVELECEFGLLTPLAESFMGSPALVHSRSEFAITSTLALGLPPPGNPPPPLSCGTGEAKVPDLFDLKNQAAYDAWTGAGFTGPYTPVVTNQNKNKKVRAQSLAAGECQPLTSSMVVTL